MATAGSSALRARLAVSLRDELGPRRVLVSANAAIILFFFEAMFALSFAALIFSHGLSDLLPAVLGSILIGAAAMVALVATFGSYGANIPIVQDAPSAVLAVAAASIVAVQPGSAGQGTLATIVVLLSGTTLLTGLTCWILGALRLGGLTRFLPYPVLGGFLAGTGWLLLTGGIGVATDAGIGAAMLDADAVVRWLPAVLLGGATLVVTRRVASPFALPIIASLALVGFYAAATAMGWSTAELSAGGWLLGPFPSSVGSVMLIDPATFAAVEWSSLVAALPLAAPAVLLSVVGLLLNSTSLELVNRRDIRLDRELVVTGGANVASGLVGGLPGYTGLSISILAHALGHGRRLPGLLSAVLMVLTVVAGMELLALVPRMLLGALLVYVGLALLVEWVFEARTTFSRVDHVVLLIVLTVIAVEGMVLGVVAGLILTVGLFVINYSRIGSLRFEADGSALHSRVDRRPSQAELLHTHGPELFVIALQGYLFFGTAYQVHARIRARMAAPEARAVRVVLLDLQHLTGIDSTAVLGLGRLVRALQDARIELVLTGMDPRIARQLDGGGISESVDGVRVFPDLDRGLQWAEDHLIAAHGRATVDPSLTAELTALLDDRPLITELLRAMRQVEVAAGDVLMRQGDEADALYLLESGQVTVFLEREGREPIRLQTLHAGRLIGEIGFFLGDRRTATVIADADSVLRALSRQEWEALARTSPDVAGALHRLTIETLGTRVVDLHRTVEALLR